VRWRLVTVLIRGVCKSLVKALEAGIIVTALGREAKTLTFSTQMLVTAGCVFRISIASTMNLSSGIARGSEAPSNRSIAT
jgi:hypothetical protein